jgi:membrane protein
VVRGTVDGAFRGAARWLFRLVGEVWGGWARHRCTQLGAAIAFYGIFSILPLLILLTSIFGFVLASWAGAPSLRDSLFRLISDGVSPQLAKIAIDALKATEKARNSLGLVGGVSLLLAASGAFGMLEAALQIVWDLHLADSPLPWRIQVMRFVRTRLVAFILVGAVALLVFLSLVLEVVLDAEAKAWGGGTDRSWRIFQLAFGFFLSGWIVSLLFRLLPIRKVPWRAALAGGWLTASLWEAAKQGLSAYLTRIDYTHAYPLLGSALALLLWVYVAGLVFLLGAEVAAAITRMQNGGPGGARPSGSDGIG